MSDGIAANLRSRVLSLRISSELELQPTNGFPHSMHRRDENYRGESRHGIISRLSFRTAARISARAGNLGESRKKMLIRHRARDSGMASHLSHKYLSRLIALAICKAYLLRTPVFVPVVWSSLLVPTGAGSTTVD